mgnify:CR=1 FL=1
MKNEIEKAEKAVMIFLIPTLGFSIGLLVGAML